MRGAKGCAQLVSRAGASAIVHCSCDISLNRKPPYIDSTRGEVGDRKSIEGDHCVCSSKSHALPN